MLLRRCLASAAVASEAGRAFFLLVGLPARIGYEVVVAVVVRRCSHDRRVRAKGSGRVLQGAPGGRAHRGQHDAAA